MHLPSFKISLAGVLVVFFLMLSLLLLGDLLLKNTIQKQCTNQVVEKVVKVFITPTPLPSATPSAHLKLKK